MIVLTSGGVKRGGRTWKLYAQMASGLPLARYATSLSWAAMEVDMAKKVTIEESFARLEKLVEQLESGELSLDEALQRYEDGLKQIRQARHVLDAYAERVERLRGEMAAESGTDTAEA